MTSFNSAWGIALMWMMETFCMTNCAALFMLHLLGGVVRAVLVSFVHLLPAFILFGNGSAIIIFQFIYRLFV